MRSLNLDLIQKEKNHEKIDNLNVFSSLEVRRFCDMWKYYSILPPGSKKKKRVAILAC